VDDYIVNTTWLRVSWNDCIAIGCGFDPSSLVFGMYIGPISVFVGYNVVED
jgi:hypothetical protein